MINIRTLMKPVIVFSMAVLLTGIVESTALAADQLAWTGCGITKKAFMLEAAKAYKAETGVTIKLSGGGATKGVRDANSGVANIGGSCRPCLPGQFPELEIDVHMTVVAWDALVPIVNKANPVKSISSSDLKKVLTGDITNWKDLGGPDLKINLVVRKGTFSGVGFMTRAIIFGSQDVKFGSDAFKVKSSGPLENKIQADPSAIGITGVSSANKRVIDGKPLHIMSVDGQTADVASISSGQYPTFRPLYLMTKGAPTGATKAFIDWILSDTGQQVIEAAGTVSLKQGTGLKAKFNHWKNTDRILNYSSIL